MVLVVCILNKGLVSHAFENSNAIHFAPYNNYCRLYNLVVLFCYNLEIRKAQIHMECIVKNTVQCGIFFQAWTNPNSIFVC